MSLTSSQTQATRYTGIPNQLSLISTSRLAFNANVLTSTGGLPGNWDRKKLKSVSIKMCVKTVINTQFKKIIRNYKINHLTALLPMFCTAVVFTHTVMLRPCLQERYELRALVLHLGLLSMSGHYTTTVKRQNGWVVCDDNKVGVS